MERARIHEGIRRMRFEDVLGRSERSELSQVEAAELLGISERTFRRWRERYRDEGPAGLSDRRLRPSSRRASKAEIERMLGLYRALYRGFTVKHFHEQLGKRHNYMLGYTVTKLHLHRAGLVTPARSRSAHRKKRPRRPMIGMMLHQDASRHAWLSGDERLYDLVATMDDATSAIYSLFLVDEEGTASSLRGVREVVETQGLFCALYTDRGSHYFETPTAGARVSKTVLTQFGRALKQLGIGHIAAYSPQARGRSERLFGTLQDRLVKELALAGINTLEAANRWMREVYIPEHNARFAVPAEQEGSAFVADPSGAWRDILCIQEDRRVGNDNTVRWHRLSLQLPPSRLRPHFVRATVRVHEYPDGTIAVFWGPHRLAEYDATGRLLQHQRQAA
ncbi:MAG TPA: ISNCY family transposase [Acidobacteriaceae bacterium]|nr:ISNCY family transposase [Acidobacteriaceae bacterium]